jgi:hypothetical protein
MRLKIFVRVVCLLALAGSLAALNLAAQDAAPSVAEAARKSQEQKKKATKPAPVVTDDTLHPNATAPAAAPESNAPAESAKESTAASEPSKKAGGVSADDEKKKKAEIDALKQRIAEQKESIKLAQRELALQQDTFYSNPDYAHDKAGKDKLDAMKSDLQQKQDVLADLQAKLAALGGTEDSTPAPDQSKPDRS